MHLSSRRVQVVQFNCVYVSVSVCVQVCMRVRVFVCVCGIVEWDIAI